MQRWFSPNVKLQHLHRREISTGLQGHLPVGQCWLCCRLTLASHTQVCLSSVNPEESPAGGRRAPRGTRSLEELQVVRRLALLTTWVEEELLPQGGYGLHL